jgi:hypothetical protein
LITFTIGGERFDVSNLGGEENRSPILLGGVVERIFYAEIPAYDVDLGITFTVNIATKPPSENDVWRDEKHFNLRFWKE